jgi:hypothetical protein
VLVDARRRGESAGDRYLVSSLLRRDGAVAGRLEAWPSTSAMRRWPARLRSSSPTGASPPRAAAVGKPIPGVGGRGEEYAITGGTGAYVGAAGTMTRAGNGARDTLTLTFGA